MNFNQDVLDFLNNFTKNDNVKTDNIDEYFNNALKKVRHFLIGYGSFFEEVKNLPIQKLIQGVNDKVSLLINFLNNGRKEFNRKYNDLKDKIGKENQLSRDLEKRKEEIVSKINIIEQTNKKWDMENENLEKGYAMKQDEVEGKIILLESSSAEDIKEVMIEVIKIDSKVVAILMKKRLKILIIMLIK